MVFNIPNLLTISRLFMIPVVSVLLYLMSLEKYSHLEQALSFWAAVVFVLAAVTDFFDGYLARKLKQVSVAGKFFDPMADKLIHMAALVLLIPLARIEAWIVVVLLFREIFITGLRAVAVSEGIVMAAGQLGKWKTVFITAALTDLIYFYPLFPGTVFEINMQWLGRFFLWLGVALAIISGFQYTYNFFSKLNKRVS